MTENTKEIIKLILENGNAEEAVMTFAKIIASLKQNEAHEEPFVADLHSIHQTSQGM